MIAPSRDVNHFFSFEAIDCDHVKGPLERDALQRGSSIAPYEMNLDIGWHAGFKPSVPVWIGFDRHNFLGYACPPIG